MLHLLEQPQRELQLDLKANDSQNHQKIELYGSPTTKDLEKPHSCRQVGRVEWPRRAERHRDVRWCGEAVAAVKQVVPHSHGVDTNQEG